jgi:hypothetical protein
MRLYLKSLQVFNKDLTVGYEYKQGDHEDF